MLSQPAAPTAVFIDEPNLSITAKKLGFEVDFKRLLRLFQNRGRLIRSLYYTTVSGLLDYQSNRLLGDWLDYDGLPRSLSP